MKIWARSILLGWATLLAIAYGVEGPLLRWTSSLIGATWIATAHLALDCATLTAAGYVTGRFNRSRAVLAGAAFAATLCFWDFSGRLALNVPFLLQLAWDAIHDSRFLDAFLTSAETHVLLFGCLIGGAMLSRQREKPVSIV